MATQCCSEPRVSLARAIRNKEGTAIKMSHHEVYEERKQTASQLLTHSVQDMLSLHATEVEHIRQRLSRTNGLLEAAIERMERPVAEQATADASARCPPPRRAALVRVKVPLIDPAPRGKGGTAA